MRKPLVIAGVGLLAAGIGSGVAVGSARTHSDPARERNAEARYTAAHRSEATVSRTGAEAIAKDPVGGESTASASFSCASACGRFPCSMEMAPSIVRVRA